MELSAVLIVIVAASLSLAYLRSTYQADGSVPRVAIREYLPGGLLYPVVKDLRAYQRSIQAVARQYGRIFYAWSGVRCLLVTAVPEDSTQIFSSEHFSRPVHILALFRTVAPGGIFSMLRAQHRLVRRDLRHRFSTAMLQSFESQMGAAVTELCSALQHSPEQVVDVSALLAMTTFRVITNVAFGSGMTQSERKEFNAVANRFFAENMKEIIGYPLRQWLAVFGVRTEFWECKRRIDEMCDIFIRRRREETGEQREKRNRDILDVFLELDGADDATVRSLVVEFALAGSHTTNQVLAWSIYETCCNESVRNVIDAELKRVLANKPLDEPITFEELQRLPYIHKVWRETLRRRPISAGLSRTAEADVTLNGSGVHVRKGQAVLVLISMLHLDPEIWKDPLEFRPERWGYGSERGEGDRVPAGAFSPFGFGFRSCPGKFLADYEGPLILAELHRRFRFELACKPHEVVSCSAFVASPRYASKKDGDFDMGVPVRVRMKS